MLKRTPGKWVVGFPDKDPEKPLSARICVDGTDGEEPVIPTIGDLTLAASAPEMYELLWQVSEEIDEALHQGVITEGIYKVSRKITALLSGMNVERQDTDKEAR